MPDPNFDSSYVSSGNSGTASVSGKPQGAAPILATIFSVTKTNAVGAQPDASWTVLTQNASQFAKILTASSLLSVAQAIAANQWVQMLAFFGSNGTLPVWTPLASGSTNNPGNGNVNNTGAIAAIAGGLDLFLFMDIDANNGFFSISESYSVFDTLGNTYTFLGGISNFDNSQDGAQVAMFHCPNCKPGAAGWSMSMRQTAGDPAHFVGVNYFFYSATNVIPVNLGSLRLLPSLGVGT